MDTGYRTVWFAWNMASGRETTGPITSHAAPPPSQGGQPTRPMRDGGEDDACDTTKKNIGMEEDEEGAVF